MSLILGLAAFGNDVCFEPLTAPVRDINYLQLKNSIIDDIEIRSRTDIINSNETTLKIEEDTTSGTLNGLTND